MARCGWYLVCTSLMMTASYVLPCLADTVTLEDGRVLEGKILKRTKDAVEVEVTKGDLTAVSYYAAKEVSEVKYGPAPREALEKEFQERFEDTKGTADAWYELGRWCTEQFLLKKAGQAFRKALEFDPDHELTRRALGYVFYDGKWAREEDVMIAKGFVKFEGSWVTPDERERVLEGRRRKEEERKAELAERKRKIEAVKDEIERRRLEKEVALLERRMQRMINREVNGSYWDRTCYPYHGIVCVPVFVGVPTAVDRRSCHSGLSINGEYDFDGGHIDFDLNL
jgi:tetratricopeptide (TPR) repeat protein